MIGMYARWAWRASLIPFASLLFGCGTAQPVRQGTPEPTVVSVSDTTLFAAVVRQIDPYRVQPLRVDPRPLRADPEITQPTPEALAEVPERVVILRTAALRRMRLSPTDAIKDAQCPGIDIPLPGMQPQHRPGCPESERYTSAAIGLPRPGGPYWPHATVASGMVKVPDVDRREPGLSLGYWSVRVIHKDVYPTGGPYSVSDYVFKRDPASGAWLFIERKVFYIAD